MTDEISITHWMGELKTGNEHAAQEIWHHFFGKLVQHAKSRMRGLSRTVADEEDVALSVMKSFCVGLQNGRFADLENSQSLWRMLVVICGRKIANQRKFQTRAKRSVFRECGTVDDEKLLRFVVSQNPTPDLATEMAESLTQMIGYLKRPELQSIALHKMEGYSNEEIAGELKCSLSTIERKLRTIRSIWSSHFELQS